MGKGFIKLNRGFFNNFLWNEAREYSKAEAWLDLIQSARFEASTELVNGKVIELQKGEIPASRRYLELRWNWGSTKVSNFLNMLEKLGMIKRKQTNGQTVLKLVKYRVYNNSQTTDKPQTNQRQTTDKPTANQNKEYKELKESEDDVKNESNADNVLFSIEALAQDYLKNKKVIEAVVKNKANKFKSKAHLLERMEEFKSHLIEQNENAKTKKDFASHFRNWNKKQPEKKEVKQVKHRYV